MARTLNQLDAASQLQDSDNFLVHQSGTDGITNLGNMKTALRTENGSALILESDTSIQVKGNLLPEMDGANGNESVRDIGSTTQTFANVYSVSFTGNLTGDVTGNLTGDVDATNISGFTLTGDILPEMTGANGDVSVRNLGSATQKFEAVYADEVFVGASSLYVNGKKVVEDVSDTMTFQTDEDQALAIKTVSSTAGTGNGNLSLTAGNQMNVTADGEVNFTISNSSGSSKTLGFSNQSTGGNISFSTPNGEAIFNHDVAISGNLTISGTTTTIDTQTVLIEDNLIQLNSSLDSSTEPASTLEGGIEINRGSQPNYRFIFEESSDTFKIGEINDYQAVATRPDSPTDGGIAIWNGTDIIFDTVSPNTAFNKDFGTSAGEVAEGNHNHDSDYVAVGGDSMTGDLTIHSRRVVTVASGSSFPTSNLGLGDECYRTDLDEWYKYNGSTWIQI